MPKILLFLIVYWNYISNSTKQQEIVSIGYHAPLALSFSLFSELWNQGKIRNFAQNIKSSHYSDFLRLNKCCFLKSCDKYFKIIKTSSIVQIQSVMWYSIFYYTKYDISTNYKMIFQMSIMSHPAVQIPSASGSICKPLFLYPLTLIT